MRLIAIIGLIAIRPLLLRARVIQRTARAAPRARGRGV